jgi:hypothetical protein
MTFSEPKRILAREAQIGDCFVGHNCSVRLVAKTTHTIGDREIIHVLKFRATMAERSDHQYETVLGFEPDVQIPLILSAAEAFALPGKG